MLSCCETGCDPLDRTGQRGGGRERVAPAGKMQGLGLLAKAEPHMAREHVST